MRTARRPERPRRSRPPRPRACPAVRRPQRRSPGVGRDRTRGERAGKTGEALEALDRATALALGGEIGVFESGFVFCNAIWACRSRGEWKRAREWTDSATRWVERRRVAYFPGLCRVHRAEVLRVRGDLQGAENESTEAARMLSASLPRWETIALVELGEVRRRRGDLAGALEAYRRALELGWEPQTI